MAVELVEKTKSMIRNTVSPMASKPTWAQPSSIITALVSRLRLSGILPSSRERVPGAIDSVTRDCEQHWRPLQGLMNLLSPTAEFARSAAYHSETKMMAISKEKSLQAKKISWKTSAITTRLYMVTIASYREVITAVLKARRQYRKRSRFLSVQLFQ